MTNSINCQSQQMPAYSGITINITNPMLNPPGTPPTCQCQCHQSAVHESTNVPAPNIIGSEHTNPDIEAPQNVSNKNIYNIIPQITEPIPNKTSSANDIQQAYPPNYYLNNYNYIQGTTPNEKQNNEPTINEVHVPEARNTEVENSSEYIENDTSVSKEIIGELDAKEAEQKELEKTGKKTKIVALTNEYIMSLENYLNNPNTEIRLMAAKDILTRLDEDHDRYDDVALNALLNKMLQDPNKLIRVAAMSAFASELASGNDYTVQLLNKIQQDPQSDPEDVLEASQILLRRSATTEIKYIPQPNTTEQKAEQK